MKCTVVILNKSKDAGSFEFDKKEITIGRVSDNDLMLDDLSISRNHAKIVESNGQFELIDLESKNGIKHSGKRVQSAKLNDQDVIQIGNVSLQFCCPELSAKQNENVTGEDATVVMGREDATIIMGNYNIAAQHPKLVVTAGDTVGKEHIINKGVLTIGRSAGNDISINDHRVSRQHAKIFLQNDGAVTIKDMGSGNGTFIRGKKINEATLSSRDEIRIGNMTLRFVGKGEEFSPGMQGSETSVGIPVLNNIPRMALVAVSLIVVGLSGFFLMPDRNDEKDIPAQDASGITAPVDNSANRSGSRSVITDAIEMYALGQTDTALSLLSQIHQNSENREWAETAGTYIVSIQEVRESFERGQTLYKENNVEGAFAEWKNTLQVEKKLPLSKKSWYSGRISYNAANELYSKGVEQSMQGNREAAINSWVKALQIAPDHKASLSRLEGIAKKLYNEAVGLAETNRTDAVRKLEEILTIVPEGNEFYEKAMSKLNEG